MENSPGSSAKAPDNNDSKVRHDQARLDIIATMVDDYAGGKSEGFGSENVVGSSQVFEVIRLYEKPDREKGSWKDRRTGWWRPCIGRLRL